VQHRHYVCATHGWSGHEHAVRGTRMRVDGFYVCPVSGDRVAVEFLGDFWHGNPAVHPPGAQHPLIRGATYGDVHERTVRRLRALRSHGYRVMYAWESDFKPWRRRLAAEVAEVAAGRRGPRPALLAAMTDPVSGFLRDVGPHE